MSLNSKLCKKIAIQQLKGRWKVPIIVELISIVLLFSFFAVFPFRELQQILELSESGDLNFLKVFEKYFIKLLALSLFTYLIIPIFSVSIKNLYVSLFKTKEKITFMTFINGFNLSGKGLLLYFYESIWISIWILPSYIFYFIFIFVTALTLKTNYIFAIIAFVCYILVLGIIAFVKSIQYQFAEYILVDQSSIDIAKALSLSVKITKNHLWELILFRLSFILWDLLCLISLGIASIWVDPYKIMAYTNKFKYLLKLYEKQQGQ